MGFHPQVVLVHCSHDGTGCWDLKQDCVPGTSPLQRVPCIYTRGDLLQGQSDLVFDWFIFLFGRRDLSHEQYTRGDKYNLRGQVFNSNQFEFVGQVAGTTFCPQTKMVNFILLEFKRSLHKLISSREKKVTKGDKSLRVPTLNYVNVHIPIYYLIRLNPITAYITCE